MRKVKIKPVATLVAQLPAGVEQDVIVEDGIMYVPMMDLGEVLTGGGKTVKAPEKEDTPAPSSKKKAAPVDDEEEEESAPTVKGEVYDEEMLMDMESDEILAILKEWKVDPSKSPGKNTHKKLRLLLLDEQKERLGSSDEDEDEDEDESPKVKSKKAALREEEDEGEEEEDEAPKTKKKKKVADEEEELVEIEDLEVDDNVNVYWATMKEWFKGSVSKITKSGKVTVLYEEDDEEEILDPEVNTKIKRLA